MILWLLALCVEQGLLFTFETPKVTAKIFANHLIHLLVEHHAVFYADDLTHILAP
jgi:hypothetical protein